MGTIASQITSLKIVHSTVYWGVDQTKHQSSASLAFVWGIHRWPVNSPHKGVSNAEMFPFWWRHHGVYAEVSSAPVTSTCKRFKTYRQGNSDQWYSRQYFLWYIPIWGPWPLKSSKHGSQQLLNFIWKTALPLADELPCFNFMLVIGCIK